MLICFQCSPAIGKNLSSQIAYTTVPRAPKRKWTLPRRSSSRCNCSAVAERQTDARGFVVPEPGDIVLYAGRWANEDAAGLVESVRFIESRDAHIVDVLELRRVGASLFAVGMGGRKKNSSKWFDIAEVRIANDAEYVAKQDAYRIENIRDGYAYVPPMDANAKKKADAQYNALKREMLTTTAVSGMLGTLGCATVFGADIAEAFGYGSVASFFYLLLLQESVDTIGGGTSNPTKKLLSLRFLLPVIPFLILGKKAVYSDVAADSFIGAVPKDQVAAVILGLLVYKLPLLFKTSGEFLDSLADMNLGTSGMVGTTLSLAARAVRGTRDRQKAQLSNNANEKSVTSTRPVFVFAGPSGAGKSTLIEKLASDFPEMFEYTISHTTRERREGEVDGVDYFFVDSTTFDNIIENDGFVEYAKVHGKSYGTSFDSINRVLDTGRACILDVDIQGIKALRSKSDLTWRPSFIWVAPPSIEVLKDRLQGRGSETEDTLKIRLDTATREMAYAATSNVFDLTIVNDDFESAYAELKRYIEPMLK